LIGDVLDHRRFESEPTPEMTILMHHKITHTHMPATGEAQDRIEPNLLNKLLVFWAKILKRNSRY
jgi:hypothetical protein